MHCTGGFVSDPEIPPVFVGKTFSGFSMYSKDLYDIDPVTKEKSHYTFDFYLDDYDQTIMQSLGTGLFRAVLGKETLMWVGCAIGISGCTAIFQLINRTR